eukprot:SAG31_NODE_1070_length_10071_cov_6.989771_6_plen_277_part_00
MAEAIRRQEVLEAKLIAAQEAKAELAKQLEHERSNTVAAMSAVTAAVSGLSPAQSIVDFAAQRVTASFTGDAAALQMQHTNTRGAQQLACDSSFTNISSGVLPRNAGTVTEAHAAAVCGKKFKTRLCSFHMKGSCSRGTSCHFAHGSDELIQSPQPVNAPTGEEIALTRAAQCSTARKQRTSSGPQNAQSQDINRHKGEQDNNKFYEGTKAKQNERKTFTKVHTIARSHGISASMRRYKLNSQLLLSDPSSGILLPSRKSCRLQLAEHAMCMQVPN